MAKLQYKCKSCGRAVGVQTSIPMSGNKRLYVWNCGHTELRDAIVEEVPEIPADPTEPIDNTFKSCDESKAAYPFQVEGVRFVEKSNFNALIADSMGLGKTIQALLTFKRNIDKLAPVLFVVKSSLVFQWAKEYREWVDNSLFSVMPIIKRENIIPGFKAYVISMDMLSRKGILDKLSALGIKFIVLDEVHSFKDQESARTRALIQYIQKNEIQHKLALSGTPVKNKASEYFTILNLLAPYEFYSMAAFKRDWLMANDKGVYTRIDPMRLVAFQEKTKPFIIRRDKTQVLTDLPPLTRDFQYITIEDPQIKQSYNKTLGLFNNFLNNNAKINSNDLLGWLAKLRAITGQAKCQAALDYITEFVDSSDEQLAVGIQHKSVRDTLYYVLDAGGVSTLKLSGEDSAYQKDRIVEAFTRGDKQVLVVNMIAGGVGLNLQSCANTLILERQWNAADEEQFEGRFHRDGQKRAVQATYMIARDTIDDFFHQMVESKRKIMGETLGNWAFTSDEGGLYELTDKVRGAYL